MPDPVYTVKVTPEEANPGPSGGNDGCLIYSLVEHVDGEERQVSEVCRVGYQRRTSKWRTKPFHAARNAARAIADEAAEELNEAVTRAAAARAAAALRRETAIGLARERVEREVDALQARIDELLRQEDEVVKHLEEAERDDADVLAAGDEVAAIEDRER